MARDPKRLREAYEFKIGKDLTDKLSDEQISLLSKYYNSLSEKEQNYIDSRLLMGYSDTPLHEMAEEFISEREEDPPAPVATSIIDDEEDDEDDFEPLGLEELLKDIGEESKRERALAIYEGTRDDDLVTEEIDERILRLLGLEEVFDIDYGTYLTLLKEKMISVRMTKQELSTEESELLTNEYKRVKGKVGRFKFKVKKISIDEENFIRPRKFLNPAVLKVDTEEAQVTEEKKESSDRIEKYLIDIISIVKSIRQLLIDKNDLAKEIRDAESKRREKERRKERENKLESDKKGNKFLDKLKSSLPRLGFFDRIKNFLLNILLGKALLSFLDWMSDSKNKKKLDTLGRFLSDWWPALLGAFVLFATPLGTFIRGTVGLISKFTKFILTKAIPKLIMFAAKNPLIAAGLIAGGATLGAYLWNKQEEDRQIKRESKKRGVPEDTVRREIEQEREGILGQIGEAFNNIGPLGLSEGGLVPDLSKIFAFSGGGFAPMGTDTIPAMLSPGEFVMSKGAVDKFGVGNLMDMNAAGGGNNKPKMRGGVSYAAGGGPIRSAIKHLKDDEGLSSLTKGKNDYIKPGGSSVISGTKWSSITPQTPIYAYRTGVVGDRATIGWGSTFYDSILSGSNPVRPGDQVTKAEADNILKVNLMSLQNTYKSRIPLWKNMSDKQKTGLLVFGYNAPQAPIGAYPTLTKALQSGDMTTAAKNIQRGGPNAARIALEKGLLLSGPKDLTEVQPPQKPTPNSSSSVKTFTDKTKPTTPGPKGLRKSLTDEEGFSGLYMKPFNFFTGGKFKNRSQLSPNMEKRELQLLLKNIQGGMLGDPNSPQNKKQIDSLIQRIHNLPKVQIPQQPLVASSSVMTLPPIDAGSSSGNSTLPNLGSQVPDFPSISPLSMETRMKKLDTYGVVG